MAHRQDSLLATLMELINQSGLEAVTDTLRILFNEAIKIEREQVLGAGLYERSENRKGYANGYKPKTLETRMGKMTVSVRFAVIWSFIPQLWTKAAAVNVPSS